MARIRSIKPEFPHSESMGRVSRDARLLFIELWTLCDDSGRARGSSRMLASLLFPYDDDAPALIDGWLDELEEQGCVICYTTDDTQYLSIPNWLKHQRIDKPSPSKIPPPPKHREPSKNPREDSCEDQGRERDQGRGVDSSGALTRADPPKAAPKRSKAASKKPTNTPLNPKPVSRGKAWEPEMFRASWFADGEQARERAELPAINLKVEREKFDNYWLAKSGAGATKVDWRRTWINWCLNSRQETGNGTRQPRATSQIDQLRAIVARENGHIRPDPGGADD